MTDVAELENELVNEIAEETGIKEGKPAQSQDLSGLKEQLTEVFGESEEVDGFLGEVEQRLANGENINDIRKEVESMTEESEESEEEEEDVIPASKHKKALESMQKRIDDLYAQVKANETKVSKKSQDSDARLEAMTSDELEDLHDELDLALVDGELDGKELDAKGKRDVVRLRRKVANLMKDAPERFRQKKIDHLKSVMPQFEKVIPGVREALSNPESDLYKRAMAIHDRSRSMQNSEMGFVDSVQIAIEQMQALPSKSQDRLKSMSSRLNKLKAKTSLAKKGSLGEKASARNSKLFEKAKSGSREDQENYILNAIVKPGGLI